MRAMLRRVFCSEDQSHRARAETKMQVRGQKTQSSLKAGVRLVYYHARRSTAQSARVKRHQPIPDHHFAEHMEQMPIVARGRPDQ